MWEDEVLNRRANADAAEAITFTLHRADPGSTGAEQFADAPLDWVLAGLAGPEPTLQPATVGICYARPAIPLTEAAVYFGFRGAGGVWLGGFKFPSPVEPVTLDPHPFRVKIGPNV